MASACCGAGLRSAISNVVDAVCSRILTRAWTDSMTTFDCAPAPGPGPGNGGCGGGIGCGYGGRGCGGQGRGGSAEKHPVCGMTICVAAPRFVRMVMSIVSAASCAGASGVRTNPETTRHNGISNAIDRVRMSDLLKQSGQFSAALLKKYA